LVLSDTFQTEITEHEIDKSAKIFKRGRQTKAMRGLHLNKFETVSGAAQVKPKQRGTTK